MPENYRLHEHTADLELEVWSHDLPGLASNAGMALGDIIGGDESKNTGEVCSTTIAVESVDTVSALVDFLSDLLTWIEIERALPTSIEVEAFENNRIAGTVRAVRMESFEEEIKAVTYHGASVEKREDGMWEARLILDI